MKINYYKRNLSKGREAVYLQITGVGKPIRENLEDVFFYTNPKTKLEKQHNIETQELVETVVAKRRLLYQARQHDFHSKENLKYDFVTYFEEWKKEYTKKDVLKVHACIIMLKDFMTTQGIRHLPGGKVSKMFCEDFTEYLKSQVSQETARSYMQKFKQVLDRAFEEKVTTINSASFKTRFKIDKNAINKPLLDPAEIQALLAAECPNEDVRRAYLLSLNTGFDFATVSNLYGWMVDKKRLVFDRSKTDAQNSFPLNKTALQLIGKIEDPEEKIFNLPGWAGAVKDVRTWAKRAGITKKITWHSARHSFATNHSAEYDTPIEVIQQLLGHTDIRTTMKYIKVKDKKKREAVDRMPDMEL